LKEEKRPLKNYLAENSDERAGEGGSKGVAQAKAYNWVAWRNLIAASCFSRDDEDRSWPGFLTIYFKGKSTMKPDHMRGDKFSW